MVREKTDSTEKELTLLSAQYQHWKPSHMELPTLLAPPGLSTERKQYLFDKIREYCPPECQDIVCPNSSCTSTINHHNRSITPLPPSPKRQRSTHTILSIQYCNPSPILSFVTPVLSNLKTYTQLILYTLLSILSKLSSSLV